MAIFLGIDKIKNLWVGRNKIKNIWLGTNKIYSTSRLPSEYQEVEYIESTGTQYIYPGISGAWNAEIDVQGTAYTSTSSIIVCAKETGGNWFGFGAGSSANYSVGATGASNVAYNIRKKIHITYGINPSNGISFYFVDNPSQTWSRAQTFVGSSVCLFSYIDKFPSKTRWFSGKFWDSDGVLIRDLVPCYRKADEEIGLYDLVGGVFYTNAGSGTFIKGDDV